MTLRESTEINREEQADYLLTVAEKMRAGQLRGWVVIELGTEELDYDWSAYKEGDVSTLELIGGLITAAKELAE